MTTRKIYTLTDEHRGQLEPWRDRWVANALRTAPQTEEDREAVRSAMRGMYEAANLPFPDRGVFVGSPLTGAIAAPIASGAWWLRDNPAEQVKLFGRAIPEDELMAAVREACAFAVAEGMRAVKMEPTPVRAAVVFDAATRAATDAATYAATTAATRAATRPSNHVVSFLARCCYYWGRFYDGGNQYSGWCSYLSFFADVARLDLPEHAKWRHYQTLAERGGPRFMHAKFWIVSDFPEVLTRDAQNRPHNETGPFCRWRDGWELHQWHGVRVPGDIVQRPETITPTTIDAQTNAEVRRVMLERFGLARYILESGAQVLHEDVDQLGLPRRLLRKPMGDGLPELVMVHVKNSTLEPSGERKDYVLAVHPELRPLFQDGSFGAPQEMTCVNAVASTFGLWGSEYRPQVES